MEFTYTKSKPYNNRTIEITDAFKMLFENKWSLQPYLNDDALPCYFCQGKWERDEEGYHMVINDGDYYIYYTSKSINLYTWCQSDNKKGNVLEGLELLTNEVYISDKETNPYELPKSQLIGEISALFFDEIYFGDSQNKFKPIKRRGKRIGRYNYVMVNEKDIDSIIIMDRVIESLEKLVKPSCIINIESRGDGNNLKRDKTVMEFFCKYDSKDNGKYQEYKKRLVYRGKRKNR